MNIRIRLAGVIFIVDLSGNLTIEECAEGVRSKLAELIEFGQTKLPINLSGVSYADK